VFDGSHGDRIHGNSFFKRAVKHGIAV